MKKVYLVAMSEVQEGVIVTDAEVTDDLMRAEKMAREFMLERVGDFFDISKDNHEDRERVLQRYLSVTNEERQRLFVERFTFQCEGLSVSATIQEDEV